MTDRTDANESMPAPAEPSPQGVDVTCRHCGGELIDGLLALPLIGRARFAYRLSGQSIETEVDAHMCAECGAITFRANDPGRIVRAAAAARAAGRA